MKTTLEALIAVNGNEGNIRYIRNQAEAAEEQIAFSGLYDTEAKMILR